MKPPLDLEHLAAELFADMPPKQLDAVEWCTARAGNCEVELAELVAYAPGVTDRDRIESLAVHHMLTKWRRAKLLERRNELLTFPKGTK